MRGHDEHQENMFSYISSEKRVPLDHPLRRVREMTDRALLALSPLFSELYSLQGRPSIAPEKLLRALLEAWANRRSFHPKAELPERGSGSGGQKLLRDTHESGTDPEARLYKRSAAGEAKPSYLGHVVMENRHGLVVQSKVTASGTREERKAALEMVTRIVQQVRAKQKPGEAVGAITVGGDKGYQEETFIQGLRELQVIPHIAEYETNPQWPNWLTAREREDPGFAISQGKRKLVEKIFGWIKWVAGMRKTKFRGRRRVDWMFTFAAAASNLVRLVKLIPAQT